MVLNSRFIQDKKAAIPLNKTQLKYKQIVEQKIGSGEYKFESSNCVICGGRNFETLSEKERYGLYAPTVICQKCGLIQSNPRMNQESYNKFYDSEYRKLYVGEEVPTQKFFDKQVKHGQSIWQFLNAIDSFNAENKTILEVGAGSGGILKFFQNKGSEVVGIDLDGEYLKYGQSLGLNLKKGDINILEEYNSKIDLVIMSHVLEHLLDPLSDLQKIKKCLTPKGIIYIEVPGVKHLKYSYDQDFLKSLQNAHTYYFSLTTLKNLAQRAGLFVTYGDETIRAILKPGEKIDNFNNDYNKTITFLQALEKTQNLNLFRLKNKIRFYFFRALRKFYLENFIKNLFYKLKKYSRS